MDYPDDTEIETTPYTEDEEARDNFFEEQREVWEEQTGQNLPGPKKPDSFFSLMKKAWESKDSTKISNLDTREIGDVDFSVRSCQRISALAMLLHHKTFAEYFDKNGEITLATAMSKKGWFWETSITQKKAAYRGSLVNNFSPQKPKWRIFGKQQTAGPPTDQAVTG